MTKLNRASLTALLAGLTLVFTSFASGQSMSGQNKSAQNESAQDKSGQIQSGQSKPDPGQSESAQAFSASAASSDSDAPTAPEFADALVRLQNYMDNTKSLAADFSSILLDDSGKQIATSSGTVAIKVPGKFRWQYDNPDPSLLVADGTDLWHFDELLEQVNVSAISEYRGANPSSLLGGDSSKITEGFTVVGSYKTEGEQWIVLETKDRNSDFVTVRIKFGNDAIELMELIDRVDQTSRISFSQIEVNPDLSDDLFVFNVPEGASLIGQPSTP